MVGQSEGAIDLTGAPPDAVDVALAPGPAAHNGAPINLLSLEKGNRMGHWQWSATTLVSGGRGKDVLGLGYVPPEEYDLTADFHAPLGRTKTGRSLIPSGKRINLHVRDGRLA